MMKLLCVLLALAIISCNEEPKENTTKFIDSTKARLDYIRPIAGESDSIPLKVSERGEVLIAYSDCYSCHTIDKRFKGPAFRDIAARYPVTEGYVGLLAQKIIVGGTGAWGYAVMAPHKELKEEDAKTMVKFILSLKE
jgi:cytochrome c